MSINIDPFTITAGTPQTIPLQEGPAQLKAVKFTNRTVFDITYNGPGHNGDIWVPSNTEFLFSDMQSSSPGVIRLISYNTTNVSPPPTGIILITLYSVDENLPSGTWPISIPQSQVQSNVNNNTLINTSSPNGTNIITIADSAGNTLTLSNDGLLSLSVNVSGTLHTIFQTQLSGTLLTLGNAGDLIHTLGSFSIDQQTTIDALGGHTSICGGSWQVNGSTSFGNPANLIIASDGSMTFQAASNTAIDTLTSAIQFRQNGTNIAQIDNTGISLLSGHIHFLTGELQRVSVFSGTGSGTYNHLCGAAPIWIGPIVSVSGSATQGFDSVTSTQAHVTLGAALAFKAFCIVA